MPKGDRAREPERLFMMAVMQLAKLSGWLCYHTHDSRRSESGFPDLVLVRGKRLLWRELKTDAGEPTHAQRAWLSALVTAGQDASLWRPSDWDDIAVELTEKSPPAPREE